MSTTPRMTCDRLHQPPASADPAVPVQRRAAAACSRPNVPFSMADRVKDISKVLDELPGWFGDRVDVSRAGVLGHSRGTVTALAAAGGSAARSATLNCQPAPAVLCWPLAREPRVKAIIRVTREPRGIALWRAAPAPAGEGKTPPVDGRRRAGQATRPPALHGTRWRRRPPAL
jgi:predicted dienelactone hydrolase